MNEKSNLEVFRTIIEEAFNKDNTSILYDLVAPDFSKHQFGLHPTIEGMAGDIHFLHTAFPDFRLSIEDLNVDGDKIWARMTARGTNRGGFMGPPNGKHLRLRYSMFAASKKALWWDTGAARFDLRCSTKLECFQDRTHNPHSNPNQNGPVDTGPF